MATKILINGKLTSIPGIYTQIKSGIKNPTLQLSYGNICIIDTGIGAGFASTPGVNGQNSQGSDSVYEFTSIQDFRSFIRGGIYWKLAENLFFPSGSNQGVSKVYFIRAAETTSASVSIVSTSSGTVNLYTKDEGVICNGTINASNELIKGWAVKLVKSTFNTDSYKLNFYMGSYNGIDQDNNIPWGGVTENNSKGVLVFSSPEFKSFDELKAWSDTSSDFSDLFSMTLSGSTNVTLSASDYSAIGNSYKMFAGGTENYSSLSYDRVLDEISELDNTFFLAPDFETNAFSINNTKLFYHIISEARFDKFLVVGGGLDKSQFKPLSVEIARSYNSDKVILVHGGYKEPSSVTKDYVTRNSLYKAASVLGRICGLAPQTPLTFKTFNWSQELHPLTKDEKEYALEKGVLCTIRDTELGFVCLQGINTLQKNNYLLNEDASSYSIAVKRIVAQLNKEIVINAKLRFFGSEIGFNRGYATAEDVKTWLFGFLQQRVASTLNDGLIISFRDIQVLLENDCYKVSYKFVPNFEVNKMVFTGVIIEN